MVTVGVVLGLVVISGHVGTSLTFLAQRFVLAVVVGGALMVQSLCAREPLALRLLLQVQRRVCAESAGLWARAID